MSFISRWLSSGVSTALSLLLGLLAVQAPGFTHDYASALLQVAAETRRDITAREDSARQFYGITAASGDDFVMALQAHEPANAATLAQSMRRAAALQRAYDAITSSSTLLQPLVALSNTLGDDRGDKEPIWQLSLSSYTARLDFSFAAAVYGFAGVMLGALLAQMIALPFRTRLHSRRLSRIS